MKTKKYISIIILILIIFIVIFLLVIKKQNSYNEINPGVNLFSSEIPPIHPFCFGKDDRFVMSSLSFSPGDFINIKDCNKKSEAYSYESQDDGYIKANYPELDGDSNMGWIEYKILGRSNDLIYISVFENSGGSGIFSSLFISEIKNDTLNIKKIIYDGGDRCNGGIYDSKFENGILDYMIYLTPYDIVNLTEKGLEAYEDLEASAESCFGYAHHQYNFVKDEDTVDSVIFILDKNEIVEDPDWINRYKYQSCFNDIYKKYIDNKNIELSIPNLKIFNQQFLNLCTKPTILN